MKTFKIEVIVSYDITHDASKDLEANMAYAIERGLLDFGVEVECYTMEAFELEDE